MPGALDSSELQRALRAAGTRWGDPLHFHAETGSTNDDAQRLAEAGAPEGTVVVADTQTAGRGRGTRRWVTPPGSGLAFSVVLRPRLPARHATRASLLAGVAVCEAIEAVAGLRSLIKWPNDLLLGAGTGTGRKVGGILAEAALVDGPDGYYVGHIVLGIGVNVGAAPPPEVVDFPSTALEVEAGRPVDRAALVGAILARLEAHYPGLGPTAEQFAPLYEAWRSRLAWIGERVEVRTPGGAPNSEAHSGWAEGTDEEGALIVRLDSGARLRVLAGTLRRHNV